MASIVRKNQTSVEQTLEEVIEETPKKIKKNWEFERQRDNKMVKGKFFYHDVPGGVLSFSYQMYKGDPCREYTIKDGEIIDLPLGVARHLNGLGKPVHEFIKDENGRSLMKVSSFTKRCSFQSLEFLSEDNFSNPTIYKAERVTDLII